MTKPLSLLSYHQLPNPSLWDPSILSSNFLDNSEFLFSSTYLPNILSQDLGLCINLLGLL